MKDAGNGNEELFRIKGEQLELIKRIDVNNKRIIITKINIKKIVPF